ncbi:GL11320 [Drosophila persimilis]|uniref:GL11320 n=1 Tax=Drosophila persimilis TaxID=7234 RepID=B4GA59_DROPE|nr:uncharacterized protein LOC6591152 [Drosophila persimilis]EDW31811.1 GL11320 [Drosophila persimilis]
MELFGNDKTMGHSWDFLNPRNEEVDESTQTDSSAQVVDSSSDDPRSSAGNEATPLRKGCLKGSPPESGNERIFVLRNCNQCHDYTVAPCGRCKCPLKNAPCKGNCKGTDEASGSCPRHQRSTDEAEPRRKGGTCPLCQNEGSDGISGGLCRECNNRIHDAMGKYFLQRSESTPYYQAPPPQSQYSAPAYGFPSYPYSVATLPLPLPPVQQAWKLGKSAARKPSKDTCGCPPPQASQQRKRPSLQSGQLASQQTSQQGPQQTPQQGSQQGPQQGPQQGTQQAGQWQPIPNGQPWSPQQPQPQQQQPIQQLLGDPNGGQPLNIIVLQDCDNNALIDQLTTAISRSGGQGHANLQPPPNEQDAVQPGYSNYSYNNPLSGYIDYEVVDFNRGSQMQYSRNMDYDDGYDNDGYMDRYQQSRSSCDITSCVAKNPPTTCACNSGSCTCKSCPKECKSDGEKTENKSCSCACNCTACECKVQETECDPTCGGKCASKCEKKCDLCELLAKALEIFITLSEPKKKKKPHRPYSIYSKKKGASNADYIKLRKNKNRKRVASGSSTQVVNELLKDDYGMGNNKTRSSMRSTFHSVRPTPLHSGMPSPLPSHMNTPVESTHELLHQKSLYRHHHEKDHEYDTDHFFLPNCEKNRCKHDCLGKCSQPPHSCRKGCKSHCRAHCHKQGGGDAAHKKSDLQGGSRQSRCFQCNEGKSLYSGRAWQEVDMNDTDFSRPRNGENKPKKNGAGCGGCAGGSPAIVRRSSAGGVRHKNGLLGLSPIAHYRPGMLKFPVNYLLTGSDTRRSLVRTAAGVTLHQTPYVDLTEATKKQLPSRRKHRKRSRSSRPAAKKWQTVPMLAPGKYALSGIKNHDG